MQSFRVPLPLVQARRFFVPRLPGAPKSSAGCGTVHPHRVLTFSRALVETRSLHSIHSLSVYPTCGSNGSMLSSRAAPHLAGLCCPFLSLWVKSTRVAGIEQPCSVRLLRSVWRIDILQLTQLGTRSKYHPRCRLTPLNPNFWRR